jgi:thioester reductase-like protein
MRRLGFDLTFDGRLRAIAGDITAPDLGLPTRRHDELAHDIAAIYHCAADVSFATPYAALRTVNVLGTLAVIRFAATGAGKALHYVSTLGQAAAEGTTMAERIYPPGGASSSGYVTSKRVAEGLVAQAAERGLPATILRPGLVTAHHVSGAMGEHDQLALGLRAALHTGILPDLPDLPIHIMPADQVAEAIVGIGRCPAAAGRVIHLHNPRVARLGDVAAILEDLGHPVRLIPVAEWAEAIGGSALPASTRLLVRMFAESPERGSQSVETTAAAALLGRPVEFSGLTAGYLQRAIAHLLTQSQRGERS